MHIPDGLLDAKTFITLDVAGAAFVAAAATRVRRALNDQAVPMMAVLAAFIFAAQMLNFPVAGGTSGHFCGGALAAMLLGPWAGALVMTLVLVVQALLFGDGGILALGANVINMGVIGPFAGWAVYAAVRRLTPAFGVRLGGAFFGAWLGVVAAATACALELVVSGTTPWNVAVPAMAGIHALIGMGEGLITVGALVAIQAARPDLLKSTAPELKA